MDFIHSKRIVWMLLCLLLITACSKSGQEDSTENKDIRPTMAEFFGTQTETSQLNFNTETISNSVLTANQASLSLFRYNINSSPDNNLLLSSWPLFGTLAFVSASSHDDTAEELNYGLNQFELDNSWARTYYPLLHSQAALISSETGFIRQDLWTQFDSQFEVEFLQQINPFLKTNIHSTNFKSGEDIHAQVANLALQTSGEDYSFYLEEYENTRLMMLNQIRIVGNFNSDTVQVESFEGLFENAASELVRSSMLRIQGKLGFFENNEFAAYRIPLSNGQLSLISIQPKDAMHEFIGNNLNSILESVNGGWETKEIQAILPVLNIWNSSTGSWLAEWLDISLLYSERFADLRSMDRHGGLYMQGMPMYNRLTISAQGLDLSGISGHAATFSPRNLFGPGDGSSTFADFELTLAVVSPYACSEETPDLQTGFILIMDTESGLVHSAMQLKELEGAVEGVTDCI